MFARCRNSAGACLLLVLAGCSDRDITTYRVPKAPGESVALAPAEAAAAGAQPAPLHWAAPVSWQPQAASGLRAASFLATGQGGATADISVVTFAGAGGDLLANINRWRGQLQLPPIAAEQLSAETSALDGPAGHFLLADIRGAAAGGKAPTAILGASLAQADRVWFFKMMGPADVVQAQKDNFLGFLRSVAPGAAAGPTPVVVAGAKAADNTNDLPHAAFVVASTDAAGAPSLRWEAPPDWRPKPVTAMRKGSYAVGPAGAEADLSITAFPGEVGGLAANVNRWRDQVGLPPLDDAAIGTVAETFDANGLHFTLVDFAGPSALDRHRILAALASWQGATWFFKLTGPDTLVEAEKPAFSSFLKTIHAQ
jgi:hypothetical protein